MSAARHAPQPKLEDCRQHGAASELLLVEGDSALASVAAVRDARSQAVLALQGKPLNAWKAAAPKVAAHAYFAHLAQAMGWPDAVTPPAPSARPRFGRLVLLFDPDADGIHIGALMTLYVQRWQPWLIAQGGLHIVRAPMAEVRLDAPGRELGPEDAPQPAYTPPQAQQIASAWQARVAEGQGLVRIQVFRGLGSLGSPLLRSACVRPATRHAHAVDEAQAQLVVQMFGGELGG